jgi:hypothetical protein
VLIKTQIPKIPLFSIELSKKVTQSATKEIASEKVKRLLEIEFKLLFSLIFFPIGLDLMNSQIFHQIHISFLFL